MTLIITALAALAVTIARFALPAPKAQNLHLGFMALMYWGASLMWCMDGVFALSEGEPFVDLVDGAAMTDDALLGISVVILGVIVWGCVNAYTRIQKRKTA